MSDVHICRATCIQRTVKPHDCPTCGPDADLLHSYYEWYGPEWTCLRCGEEWNEDGRCQRPFEPKWRERNLRAAFRLAREPVSPPQPGAGA